MEHEFEVPPASPAIKAAAGIIVVLVVAVISHLAGFVDLGSGGGNDGVEVSDNDTDLPVTTDVPETLAFDEGGRDSSESAGTELSPDDADSDATGGSGDSPTQPTVVERIELNPEVNASTSTTSTSTTTTTSTTEVPESSSTTDPDESTSTTEAPEFDENGDPIEDDPASDYVPVIRDYGDSPGGSS